MFGTTARVHTLMQLIMQLIMQLAILAMLASAITAAPIFHQKRSEGAPGQALPGASALGGNPTSVNTARPAWAVAEVPTRGSWLSNWGLWSKKDPTLGVTTQEELIKALRNREKEVLTDAEITLNPVRVHYPTIQLPGNGWDAQIVEQMRHETNGKTFQAVAQNGQVYRIRGGNILTLSNEPASLVRNGILRHQSPTVLAPNFARPAAEATTKAKFGLGWMERLTQGAKSWFGSAAKYIRPA